MANQITWFITGCSRGIGLQLVRQLTSNPDNIIVASCRNPESADQLNAFKSEAKGRLHIVQLDVTDKASIKAAAAATSAILGESGLDYLLNNAAVSLTSDLAFNLASSDLLATFESNVVGPALIAQAFLSLLEKGNRKVIMNTTSGLASFGLDIGQKNASYSITKTALNMLTYKQAREKDNIIAFVLDPGWVKTKMGGEGAYLEPEESVTPMLKFLTSVTREHSGKFFNHKGESLPW